MTLHFSPPRYHVHFVRRFERASVREHAFEFKKVFAQYISGDVDFPPTNVPIPIPRFTMADNKRTLVGNDNNIQLTLDLSEGLPRGKSLDEILRRPAELMDDTSSILPVARYFSAVVVIETLPFTAPQVELGRALAGHLRDVPLDDVISASFNVMRQKGDLYVLTEASQVKFFINPVPGQMQIIDADFGRADFEGLQLKADVSNKPTLDNPVARPYVSLLKNALETMDALRAKIVAS